MNYVPVINRRYTAPQKSQRGVVLVVTLVMLLLVTVIVFSAMRTSALDLRIAMTAEMKTSALQAAESALVRTAESTANFGAPLPGAAPAVRSYTFPIDADKSIVVTTQVRYVEATALNSSDGESYSIVQGNAIYDSGGQTTSAQPIKHYEVYSSARTLPDTGLETALVSGLYFESAL